MAMTGTENTATDARTRIRCAAHRAITQITATILPLALVATPAAAQQEGGESNALIDAINAVAPDVLAVFMSAAFLAALVFFGASSIMRNPQDAARYRGHAMYAALVAVLLFPFALFIEFLIGQVPGGSGIDIAPWL